MAFGKHWEWRAFSERETPLMAQVRGLPPLYPAPQSVVDRYLWIPDCPANVKLRFGDCKIKRRLQTGSGGIEEWIEDEEENRAFPLHAGDVVDVATALGVSLVSDADAIAPTPAALISILARSCAGLSVIEVDKRRWQYRYPADARLIIELAEIRAPEPALSLSFEGPSPDAIESALETFSARGTQRALSYLDALEVWGRGGSLFV